jgi:hypothetical protein
MTVSTYAKNNFMNGEAFDFVSAHTGFPGVTGANEVTGGAPAYARKAYTVAAASGGSRSASAAVFDVPACTVSWLGFWNAGNFLFGLPNGGATPKNFAVAPDTDIVWSTSHGWLDTQKIVFFQGVPPPPLAEGTTYFVRDSTAHGFKVAATSGGVAIDLTGGSSVGCWMAAISETIYASQNTHTLSAGTFVLPD